MRFQDLRLAIICFLKSQGRGHRNPHYYRILDKCRLFQPQDFPCFNPFLFFLPESPLPNFYIPKTKSTQYIQEYSVQVHICLFVVVGLHLLFLTTIIELPLSFRSELGPGRRASPAFRKRYIKNIPPERESSLKNHAPFNSTYRYCRLLYYLCEPKPKPKPKPKSRKR